jgi:hypothetical protein
MTVTTLLDAAHDQMIQAIASFRELVRRSDASLALFYYAGHAFQLDWRNFLIPVDADLIDAQDVRSRCVDLASVLSPTSSGRMAPLIVVVDACRDNPFGAEAKLDQKGLSQIDAPPGTLIAFATSPGKVAADGSQRNGLYTGHLVKQLSDKGSRIEDALKRVRLSVRLESHGAQVPWESTSLESDVYLFAKEARPLSWVEAERAASEESAAWSRIRESREETDWIEFLQRFPSGRFAEIAQARLDFLTLAAGGTKIAAVRPPAQAASVLPQAGLRLGKGLVVPPIAVSSNPNSAGSFSMRRPVSVGDVVVLRNADPYSKVGSLLQKQVLGIDNNLGRVTYSDGSETDLLGNPFANPQNLAQKLGVPVQLFPNDILLGKKWYCAWNALNRYGDLRRYSMNLSVTSRELVTVPAGTFHAFKIQGTVNSSGGSRNAYTIWVVPGLIDVIKFEVISSQSELSQLIELVELRQARSPYLAG